MSSLNKVMLIGRLGKDPEIKYTQGGQAIANLGIATSESWKDKNGEKQEKTEWHRVVMFGKIAELAEKYLEKGRQIYIEGKLQTRKWQDKQGNDRYSTEIVARQMTFLGDTGGDNSSAKPGQKRKGASRKQGWRGHNDDDQDNDQDDGYPF